MDFAKSMAFQQAFRVAFLRMVDEKGGEVSFDLRELFPEKRDLALVWKIVGEPPRIVFTVITKEREQELLKEGAERT